MNPNLLIEKNIQLRHTYLKVTAFSIAFSESRLTRISLVQFCLRNAGSFIASITYHWLCISELINLITFQQTFRVAQSKCHGERAKILLEEKGRTSWNFSHGKLDQAKYPIFRVIITTEWSNFVTIYPQWIPD